MRWIPETAPVRCARCGERTEREPSSAQWCRTCGVFLCVPCTGGRRCPGGRHWLRGPNPWYLGWVYFTAVLLLMGAIPLAFDLDDGARAAIPVTPIAELQAGTRAKVSGTMQALTGGAIWLLGDADTHWWSLISFRVVDASGSVVVDPSPLQDSTSFREVEQGLHAGDYWDGDPVSVIGTVHVGAFNETTLVAEYIARSPTSFAHFDPFMVGAFALAVGTGVGAVTGRIRHERRLASHEARYAAYPHKVRMWRPCPSCGHRVDIRLWACDLCDTPTQWGA